MNENTMDLVMTLLIAAVAFGWFIWLWRQKRRFKAAPSWPVAEAIIETGTIESVAAVKGSKVQLPVFAFSYLVSGEYYSGRFALMPYITDPGESLVKRMIGRKLEVHYDPVKPQTWLIADELIEGCKVEQKSRPGLFGFYPSD